MNSLSAPPLSVFNPVGSSAARPLLKAQKPHAYVHLFVQLMFLGQRAHISN